MKRAFTILSMILFAQMINAQVCVPDTELKDPGFYPADLPPAFAGMDYEAVLQVRSIADTVVNFAGNNVRAFIDSIQLTGVIGLPAGFSYSCFTSNCTFLATETRCAKLNGQPSTIDVGAYPLLFPIIIYARIGTLRIPQPDTIRTFTLYVSDGGMSVSGPEHALQPQLYPNPASGKICIQNIAPNKMYRVFTAQGKLVYEGISNANALDLDSKLWSSGLYFIDLPASSGARVRKSVIISH